MSILDKAELIINGDREQTYGDAGVNLRRIAALWSTILGMRDITPDEVCLCMIAVKIARLVNTPGHEDSMVDIAGYAALMEKARCQ